MANTNASRFQAAISAFDRENSQDPNTLSVAGVQRPRELVDAERLSVWVERLAPHASEALRLAARCQHIRRWQIPRGSFPSGRVGYLQWRTQLGRFHADTVTRILEQLGYERDSIDAVRRINLKQGLHSNPDTQTMEDALCLAFLEFEFAEFCAKYPAEKVIEVVQKTWKKMSAQGHDFALRLPFEPEALALVQRALTPADA
ncbi:MAG TPA: DUF4202 domain-containing protein [Polyangiaceae bacterium]|nr:DUF4202 domain-containing protein [Polyangiaceae bacterium]